MMHTHLENNIVTVHCREQGSIGKYVPRGPRDLHRQGLCTPWHERLTKGNLEGRGKSQHQKGQFGPRVSDVTLFRSSRRTVGVCVTFFLSLNCGNLIRISIQLEQSDGDAKKHAGKVQYCQCKNQYLPAIEKELKGLQSRSLSVCHSNEIGSNGTNIVVFSLIQNPKKPKPSHLKLKCKNMKQNGLSQIHIGPLLPVEQSKK